MPITPRYNLTQTSSHLHIEVSIPHVRVSTSTLEIRVLDGTEVNLYAPPTYLLRLTLPDRVIDEEAVEGSLSSSSVIGFNPIQEGESLSKLQTLLTKDDLPKLQYNPEKNHGTLVIILRKEVEGFWQDLDLLGRLQQPSQIPQKKMAIKLVQEINENGEELRSSEINETKQVMEEFLSVKKSISYGLFKRYSNVFRDYAREGLVHEMLECPNPDEVISNEEDSIWQEEQQRRELRLHIENEKFDKDRYLNDLDIENEGDMIFDSAVMMKPHWTMEISESKEKCDSFFSSDESHLLAELPRLSNTPANLSIEQKKSGFLCLLDILFAYVYDHRTTDGDPTVESSWTVMISSPTLSWLECYNSSYDTISDVIRWSIRRSLIYPYIRSYNLAKHIAEDVCIIMKRGRRTILRCLLQLHKIMEQSESHYLFNKLYIDPMIGWIQQCDEDDVKQFGNELEKLCKAEDSCSSDLFGKYHLGLDLEDIEKRFFESDGEKHESSYDDDDEDISCSVDYESDDESGGDTEITTDEEGAQTSGEEEKYSELLENAMEKLVVNEDS